MNKKTRLLHIGANRYPPLPAEHHTKQIWEKLSQGFDEYHVLARSHSLSPSSTSLGNLNLHLLPSFSKYAGEFFFSSWLMLYFIVKHKPTHLLAQCPVMGGIAAAVFSKLFNLPLFVEVHGNHYFAPVRKGIKGIIEFKLYKLLSKPVFRAATNIRSLSEDMSANLYETYGANLSSKVINIPTRVDLSVFNEAKSSYSIAGALKIITVGSLSPVKNHINLIKDLVKTGISFELTIVGSGPLKPEYMKVLDDLSVANKVFLTGSINHSELAKLLLSQDIYIHYSNAEGLPRAVLEAMAIGLPVITSPVGFIKGIFVNNQNSIVLETPLSISLPKALNALSTSENIRRRLGVNARAMIEKDFDAEKVFQKYRLAILDMRC